MYDPTYTGKSRKTLEAVVDENSTEYNSRVSFFTPPQLTGRQQRAGNSTPRFTDRHSVGYSRFDHKGSVLFANIDAVLNLSYHVGGYFTSSTQNDNMHFYSLFFEDRNLELYSYLQWRLPYSITRLISSKSVGRPDLENVNLDLVDFDIPSILEGRPIDGYQLMGINSHQVLSLRTLTTLAMIMFSSLAKGPTSRSSLDQMSGKGFFVFPYGKDKQSQGVLSTESLLDFVTLLSNLFKTVWVFRPYMCYDFICLAVSTPKEYPAKCSDEEEQLLSIWKMLDVITESSENITSPTRISSTKDFRHIFTALNTESIISSKVIQVIEAKEPLGRDRVEVLSRWQIPDQLLMNFYPKFTISPSHTIATFYIPKKSAVNLREASRFRRKHKIRSVTP